MNDEIFLGTSYTVALAIRTDQYHGQAAEIAVRLRGANRRLVTTQAVVLEIGSMLSTLQHRQHASQLLTSMYRDPRVQVVSLTDELLESAIQLFANRNDKEWGLTDCLSFVVMNQRGITDALTSDHHFRQAGYRALLLDDIELE